MIDVKMIAEMLKRPGYSQKGLAEALGKSESVVTRILQGTRPLKALEVPIIEKYLGAEGPITTTSATEDIYHLALGRAIATWNGVEYLLDVIAATAVSALDEDHVYVLFRAIRPFAERVRVLDVLIADVLRSRRNELDTWRSLSQRLRTASERRMVHGEVQTLRAGTRHSLREHDVYFGGSPLGARIETETGDYGLTAEQIDEDRALFETIATDLGQFNGALWRLRQAEIMRMET